MQDITFDDKKLKIGIVIDQLLAGGVQLSAIEQVKELNKLGHKAKLLILIRKIYPTDFSYLVKNVPHQYLSDSYPIFFRKTIKFPVFSFLSTLHLISPLFAPRVLRKDKYDILVSLGTTTCMTSQAIYRAHKIPYIAVIHDPIIYILKKVYAKTILRFFFPLLYPLALYFEHSFLRDAKKTVIISKVHYNYLKKNYGIIPVIHTFGAEPIKSLPKKRGSQLLSFGRWQNEKNPFFLLKLIKTIPNRKLIIAGSWIDDRELRAFKKTIKKEDLGNKVILVAHFDAKILRSLCRKARLFVHPHFEAFGLAALEAAGNGLPIIIPQKSGVTEIFHHGIDGFFPTKVDVGEYTKYINKLLLDERRAYDMGAHAWKTVKEKFSWEVNARHLLQLIYEVIPSTDNKPKIYILETGHILNRSLAGGDKLMEPMAIRLVNKYTFSVIVTRVGAEHWEHASLKKEITVLKHNPFDQSDKPIYVFLTYCMRMLQTFLILNRKLKKTSSNNKQTIIYSSTDILPDILPAYYIKKLFPHTRWIARVHHLILPPHKRRGNMIINSISYLMQYLSLRMMRSTADLTIALNTKLSIDLQNLGFRKEKLKVLGGGIEFNKINNIKPQKTVKFHAVFLGRLHRTKGVFDTVPIWKEVTKKLPHAQLGIIGDGPTDLKIALQKRINSESLSDNIHLLGYLPYNEVYRIMKNADLFLFLDHEAGWGLAIAEAMACGLPIVGYDINVLGTVFKQGHGRIIPLGNRDLFSKELIYLLQNEKYRKKLSYEAVSEAAKHDWKITSNKFSSFLNRLVS